MEECFFVLNGKQRALLRKMANGIEPSFIIGKDGVTENTVIEIRNQIEARELIKIKILDTALLETKTVCNEIAEKTGAEPVQAIGSKFVLYKQAKKEEKRKIIV